MDFINANLPYILAGISVSGQYALIAIGISYLLQNLAWYITSSLAKQYLTIPWISSSIAIGSSNTRIAIIITPILTLFLVIALVLLIKYTKVGMAMRAVSRDFETSQLMGIKINSVIFGAGKVQQRKNRVS